MRTGDSGGKLETPIETIRQSQRCQPGHRRQEIEKKRSFDDEQDVTKILEPPQTHLVRCILGVPDCKAHYA